ncbi:M15 family metallopeptidase [Agromyces sp. MMS24-K17]|uniref:M15 family metallopeptidase n=1 Tax=Agromyces sp. MMS24-K17 TaxID=3372850 RepID=UPI0037546D8A
MHRTAPPPRSTSRRRRGALAAVLAVVAAAAVGTVLAQSAASSSLPWSTPTEADGVLPEGVTVFDDAYPGVANLDPALLEALRSAATDASAEGIEFLVNSGWRSAAYQDDLLRDAVAEYGSAAEAARWVATAETSPHVQGDAVDLGPFDATYWLSQFGAAYGLCQVYANESWHYELRPDAVAAGCPAAYPDPTSDPRMQP